MATTDVPGKEESTYPPDTAFGRVVDLHSLHGEYDMFHTGRQGPFRCLYRRRASSSHRLNRRQGGHDAPTQAKHADNRGFDGI